MLILTASSVLMGQSAGSISVSETFFSKLKLFLLNFNIFGKTKRENIDALRHTHTLSLTHTVSHTHFLNVIYTDTHTQI